jgi:hypothetical protein
MAQQFSFLLATISEQLDIRTNELRSMLEQREQAYKKSRDQEYQNSARQKLQSVRRKALVFDK